MWREGGHVAVDTPWLSVLCVCYSRCRRGLSPYANGKLVSPSDCINKICIQCPDNTVVGAQYRLDLQVDGRTMESIVASDDLSKGVSVYFGFNEPANFYGTGDFTWGIDDANWFKAENYLAGRVFQPAPPQRKFQEEEDDKEGDEDGAEDPARRRTQTLPDPTSSSNLTSLFRIGGGLTTVYINVNGATTITGKEVGEPEGGDLFCRWSWWLTHWSVSFPCGGWQFPPTTLFPTCRH